jgi:hypothetical protein
VDDHHVRIARRLPLDAFGLQVTDADAFVEHQLADVDGDVLRNLGRQHLDLDLAVHEVDDASLLLDPLRLSLQHDGDGDGDGLVHRDLVEVGVEQLVIDGVELVLLDEHARVAAVELQADERVHARLRVQDPHQVLRVDGDLHRLAFLGPVEHRGNPPARAQASRFVLASSFTLFCF